MMSVVVRSAHRLTEPLIAVGEETALQRTGLTATQLVGGNGEL